MITIMAECDPHLKVKFLSETSTLNVSFSNFSELFDQTGSKKNSWKIVGAVNNRWNLGFRRHLVLRKRLLIFLAVGKCRRFIFKIRFQAFLTF